MPWKIFSSSSLSLGDLYRWRWSQKEMSNFQNVSPRRVADETTKVLFDSFFKITARLTQVEGNTDAADFFIHAGLFEFWIKIFFQCLSFALSLSYFRSLRAGWISEFFQVSRSTQSGDVIAPCFSLSFSLSVPTLSLSFHSLSPLSFTLFRCLTRVLLMLWLGRLTEFTQVPRSLTISQTDNV